MYVCIYEINCVYIYFLILFLNSVLPEQSFATQQRIFQHSERASIVLTTANSIHNSRDPQKTLTITRIWSIKKIW